MLIDPGRQRLAVQDFDAIRRQLCPLRISDELLLACGNPFGSIASCTRHEHAPAACLQRPGGNWLRDFALEPRGLVCRAGLELPARLHVSQPLKTGSTRRRPTIGSLIGGLDLFVDLHLQDISAREVRFGDEQFSHEVPELHIRQVTDECLGHRPRVWGCHVQRSRHGRRAALPARFLARRLRRLLPFLVARTSDGHGSA